MGFSVRCECGETLSVSASDAGTTIACSCRRTLEVPRLSALRATAGSADDFGSVLERVRSLIKRGELPSNSICPLTGGRATMTLWMEVQCEREWTQRTGAGRAEMAILIMIGGWLGTIAAATESTPEVFGSEVTIMAPLRLSPAAAARVERMRWQWSLKRTLATTPIYKELLRSYPQARVVGVHLEHSTFE